MSSLVRLSAFAVVSMVTGERISGEYCGAISFLSSMKLSTFVSFDDKTSTVSFILGKDDDRYPYHGRVKYHVDKYGVMTIDASDLKFMEYLRTLPVPVTPANFYGQYDAKSDKLDCIFDSFVKVRNPMTKDKCKAPFLFGTYVSSDNGVGAQFDNDKRTLVLKSLKASKQVPHQGEHLNWSWRGHQMVFHHNGKEVQSISAQVDKHFDKLVIVINGNRDTFTPKRGLLQAGLKWAGLA